MLVAATSSERNHYNQLSLELVTLRYITCNRCRQSLVLLALKKSHEVKAPETTVNQ